MAKLFRHFCAILGSFWLLINSGHANAKALITVWTLEPMSPLGDVTADYKKPFLTQRILPYRAARLTSDAVLAGGKIVPSGTYLFIVFHDDGQFGFCTQKDRSFKNSMKSLFMPIMDKRPCFVDSNRDGMFESAFSVFDKYGTALTPSGNIASAQPLQTKASYEAVSPQTFPSVQKLSYSFSGKKDLLKMKVAVQYDNGSGYKEMRSESPGDEPGYLHILNLLVKINQLTVDSVLITLSNDNDIYIIGDSGGYFEASKLPPYILNWQ